MLAALEPVEPIGENGTQLFGGNLVQNLSHLAVLGDRMDLKDIAQVAELFSVLDPSLKLQQRRVLEKHHGKGAHQAIMQAVVDFTALSAVIEPAELHGHRGSERFEAEMFFGMHGLPLPIV